MILNIGDSALLWMCNKCPNVFRWLPPRAKVYVKKVLNQYDWDALFRMEEMGILV